MTQAGPEHCRPIMGRGEGWERKIVKTVNPRTDQKEREEEKIIRLWQNKNHYQIVELHSG